MAVRGNILATGGEGVNQRVVQVESPDEHPTLSNSEMPTVGTCFFIHWN